LIELSGLKGSMITPFVQFLNQNNIVSAAAAVDEPSIVRKNSNGIPYNVKAEQNDP
jgi:hypothetical protein